MVRGQWEHLARMPGLWPYSFSKDILGFLMITENHDLGLKSHPKDRFYCCIQSVTYMLFLCLSLFLKMANKLFRLSFFCDEITSYGSISLWNIQGLYYFTIILQETWCRGNDSTGCPSGYR